MQKNSFQSVLNKRSRNTILWFRKRWADWLIVLIITGAVLYSYRDLPNVYFMHDEWRTQAGVFIDGITFWINRFSIMQLLLGLDRSKLLGALSNNVIYYFFPFRSDIFIYQFHILHIINSLFLFLIIKKVTNNRAISLLSSVFFATSSTGQQALSWIGAGLQILYAVFFSLISLLFLYQYSLKKINIYFVASLFFCYMGYLFKEIGIIPVLFLLYVYYIIGFKKHNKGIFIGFIAIASVVILYLFLASGRIFFFIKFIFNCLYYPFISLSQSFIPFRFTYRIGTWFLYLNYPIIAKYNDAPTIVHFIITDLVSILFSTVIIFVGYLIVRRNRDKGILWLAIAWYFLSFIPISFALTNRNASYIDSRHMYEPMIGASIIFSYIMISFIKQLGRLKHYGAYLMSAVIVLVLMYLVKQISITQREVKDTAISGIQMTKFIRALKNAENSREIPNKPVYYFSSDRNYYYEGNKLPFLLGSGYVLSIIEYPSGHIPKEVLKKEMFIDFGSQGYFENGSKGYGYYYDLKLLLDDVKLHKFTPNQIIGFSYDSQTHEMIDITNKIRNDIIQQ